VPESDYHWHVSISFLACLRAIYQPSLYHRIPDTVPLPSTRQIRRKSADGRRTLCRPRWLGSGIGASGTSSTSPLLTGVPCDRQDG